MLPAAAMNCSETLPRGYQMPERIPQPLPPHHTILSKVSNTLVMPLVLGLSMGEGNLFHKIKQKITKNEHEFENKSLIICIVYFL